MKKLSKVISAVLSATLVLSAAATAASAQAKIIDIDYWGEEAEYVSEITDDITVKSDSSCANVCYGFTADKSGFYKVNHEEYSWAWISGDAENDMISGFRNDEETSDNMGTVFEMEAGETEYIVFSEDQSADTKAGIEYLGTIESIESSTALVRNSTEDMYVYRDNSIELYPDIAVGFSEGKTETFNGYIYTKLTGNIEDIDSVTADVELFGDEHEITCEFIDGSELVKSIAIPDGSGFTFTYDYNGDIVESGTPDYYIVTLADGTTEEVSEYDYITLSNGRDYFINWWLDEETGMITYDLGGFISGEVKATTKNLDVNGNIRRAIGNGLDTVRYSFFDLIWCSRSAHSDILDILTAFIREFVTLTRYCFAA